MAIGLGWNPRSTQIGEHEVREDRGAGKQGVDAPLEIVVRSNRREGDRNSDCCRDERLCNARHHGLRGHLACGTRAMARSAVPELFESFDDADDRSEEPYERGIVSERAEVRE